MESQETAARYRRFADEEARGRSPLYEAFALGVAADEGCLRFLLDLPSPKRQPNLFLAAVRCVGGEAEDWSDFRRRFVENEAAVRALMLARSTQTNEPARCAVLLPLLARLPGPLALLEVGASAGLCLLPDRYAYDYGVTLVRPSSWERVGCSPSIRSLEEVVATPALPSPRGEEFVPFFRCDADAATPVPTALPEVAWRAGLDLNPLDVNDPEDAAWLEALVWPGQPERLARLRQAMAVTREARPRVERGDLRRDLGPLAAEAPGDATLVVFHTAVLSYVPSTEEREAFARTAMALGRWVSNEGAGVFPGIAREAPKGAMVLALDGQPVAWTDPHGASIRWIDA